MPMRQFAVQSQQTSCSFPAQAPKLIGTQTRNGQSLGVLNLYISILELRKKIASLGLEVFPRSMTSHTAGRNSSNSTATWSTGSRINHHGVSTSNSRRSWGSIGGMICFDHTVDARARILLKNIHQDGGKVPRKERYWLRQRQVLGSPAR